MSKDIEAGYVLAKQVFELAAWLGQAPGFIAIPDYMFDSLDSMAETAAATLGLEIPDWDDEKDEDDQKDAIDIVVDWLNEYEELNPPKE